MQRFLHSIRIFFRAALDSRTPVKAKLVLGSGLLYGLVPIDLIPDLLPLIGMADDATVVIMVILAFLHMTKGIRRNLDNEDRYRPR